MIRVEILYPDAARLYGDLQNIEYLRKSCAEIEVIEDALEDSDEARAKREKEREGVRKAREEALKKELERIERENEGNGG